MRRKNNICSIFGQIEAVVAHEMALERRVTLISAERIPPSALYNEKGERAFCAVVFTPEAEREFDQRVANLRA